MRILNLGCGSKTSDKPEVTNIDWSIYLRIREIALFRPIVPLIFRGERLKKFNALPSNVMVHDLSNGIPFESGSVDVVYHSHMLEHLDRDVAEFFLTEVHRVLKHGGIQRIVVPDFEIACRSYLDHIASSESNPDEVSKHDYYIATLLEQSIRKEAFGTSRQNTLRRFIENLVLGDARKRGETHQWMYDKINLKAKLIAAGYREVHLQNFDTSLIPNWLEYALDIDITGKEYKPDSLYVEARK